MAALKKDGSNLYKWIRIGGLLSFIPFVLVAGPLGGYFIGSYLEKRFGFPGYVALVLIAFGFAGSAMEIVKIIKAAIRSEGK